MKTYAQAKSDILSHLQTQGWTLSDKSLKIPHATKGSTRLWFKSQAVYVSKVSGYSQKHEFANARTVSYDLDTRKLSAAQFEAWIVARFDC